MHQSRIFRPVAPDRKKHSRVQKGRTNAPESNFSVGCIRAENAFPSAKRANQCSRVECSGGLQPIRKCTPWCAKDEQMHESRIFCRLHPTGKCTPECKKDEPMHKNRIFRSVASDRKMHRNAFQSTKRTNKCTRVEFSGRLHPIGKCIPEW